MTRKANSSVANHICSNLFILINIELKYLEREVFTNQVYNPKIININSETNPPQQDLYTDFPSILS
jgi:hypothetical protein